MKSSLRKAVEHQNSLVSKEIKMSATTLVILKEGTYNNDAGRRGKYKPGALLITTAQYAAILVGNDCASYDVPEKALAALVAEEAKEPEIVPFSVVPNVTKDVEAALVAMGADWATINSMDVTKLTKVQGLGPKIAAKLKAQAEKELAK